MKSPKQTYYLLGIGGIGISGLAQYLVLKGHTVYGYDRVSSPMTKNLKKKGILIVHQEAISALPESVALNTTIVVYSAAISLAHPHLAYFLKQGNKVMKRSVFLGQLCRPHKTIAVGGTHGKTTTLSILAHIFKHTGQSFTAFLGGVLQDYDTNFIHTGSEYILVEADEYDRSFLTLHPAFAGITNIEADHLDIYQTPENLSLAFHQFSKQVSDTLVHTFGLTLNGLTYGIEKPEADYNASQIKTRSTGYIFDLSCPKGTFRDITFRGIGIHNLSNALGAVTLADQVGIPLEEALEALATFPGVQRRMNVYAHCDNVIIDDYAHHPTEIDAVRNTLVQFYPKQNKTVVFQPHLFSRTQDFLEDFAAALSKFDRVYVLDIYPARETPIVGIDAHAILNKMNHPQKSWIAKEGLENILMDGEDEVYAFLGAGDIGLEVQKIVKQKIKI